MVLSFRDRKRLGRIRRKVREAESRINLAIIKRMQQLKQDPDFMKYLDGVVVADVEEMKRDKDGWLRRATSPPSMSAD